MSHPSVTKPASESVLLAERRQYKDFAVSHSEPFYREVLGDLYRSWLETNRDFFHSQLHEPHLTIGQTPPRCLGLCSPKTDWGGDCQITITESLVFGKHRIVVNRWPAAGTKRFIRDVVLHESIHQYQWEVSGNAELAYRGHGPEFTKFCNEIGAQLDLAPVVPRRRGRKDLEKPIANCWPHNVRPAGFYGRDIDLDRIVSRPTRPQHCSHCGRCLENILGFLEGRGPEATRRLLEKEIGRQRARGGSEESCACEIDALDEACP